jgi:hypothetical protein
MLLFSSFSGVDVSGLDALEHQLGKAKLVPLESEWQANAQS